MKYTLIIAALLGQISAVQLQNHNHHHHAKHHHRKPKNIGVRFIQAGVNNMDAPVGTAGGEAAAAVVESAVPTEAPLPPAEPTKKREDMSPAEKKEADAAEKQKIS